MKKLPTPEYLREALDLNPRTGLLTWRFRPRHHFQSEREHKRWNTRYAGTPALSFLDKNGYKIGLLDRTKVKAHRVIWVMTYGREPKDQIDHINNNRSDNSLTNLREASQSENSRNRRLHRNNIFGLKGVTRAGGNRSTARQFRAQINICGKVINLGRFPTQELAHAAYVEATKLHFGEFARAR
jgi:hypothetical protein